MDEQSIKRLEELKADLWESFSSSYLNLISIIQSAVLATLIYNIQELNFNLEAQHYLIIVINFLLIICIWNEYRMGSVLFYWFQNIFDTFIPFALGVIQFMLISKIQDVHTWLFYLFIFFFFGTIAYLNMYFRAKWEQRQNESILKVVGRFKWVNPAICFALSLIFLSISRFVKNNNQTTIVSCFFVFILIIGFIIRGEIYWGKVKKYSRQIILKKDIKKAIKERGQIRKAPIINIQEAVLSFFIVLLFIEVFRKIFKTIKIHITNNRRRS